MPDGDELVHLGDLVREDDHVDRVLLGVNRPLLERGQRIPREQILRKLVDIQYERNDVEFGRGTFRVRGDIVEVYPSYEEQAVRIGLFGDEVDELVVFDPLTGRTSRRHDRIAIYPKSNTDDDFPNGLLNLRLGRFAIQTLVQFLHKVAHGRRSQLIHTLRVPLCELAPR